MYVATAGQERITVMCWSTDPISDKSRKAIATHERSGLPLREVRYNANKDTVYGME